MNNIKKTIIFDLDETLGYFTEFGSFCDCLDTYFKDKSYSNTHFKTLLDLYPEFLRPYIIDILKYITLKKQQNKCYKVMIYTNNNGPKNWVKNISKYFDDTIKYNLFDQIISAFKIKGEPIELSRTTYDKTIDDLFRCTKLPDNIEICFIDDSYHDGMSDERVYYINVKPYRHNLHIDELIKRYLGSKLSKDISNIHDFVTTIKHEFKIYDYNTNLKLNKEQEIDSIIGKKMYQHIRVFFSDDDNKNPKRNSLHKQKTK